MNRGPDRRRASHHQMANLHQMEVHHQMEARRRRAAPPPNGGPPPKGGPPPNDGPTAAPGHRPVRHRHARRRRVHHRRRVTALPASVRILKRGDRVGLAATGRFAGCFQPFAARTSPCDFPTRWDQASRCRFRQHGAGSRPAPGLAPVASHHPDNRHQQHFFRPSRIHGNRPPEFSILRVPISF